MRKISDIRFPWLKTRADETIAAILDRPGMFRDFARLSNSDEIRAFADGLGEHASPKTWRNAIQKMRRAVRLWDKVKDSGTEVQRRALQLEIHRALTDMKTPSFTTIGLTSELRVAVYPVNLLAYMWLTFARVVSGEIEERRCKMFERCHGYVYVGRGPGLQRVDTTTCGAACRQKKKRQKSERGGLSYNSRQ